MHNVITNGSLIFASVLTFAKESSQRKEFANFSYKNSIDIYLKIKKINKKEDTLLSKNCF